MSCKMLPISSTFAKSTRLLPSIRTFATHSSISVHKITPRSGSAIDFGAEIRGADLEQLDENAFSVIRKALYENQVIMFKDQQNLSPRAQFRLTQMFDPAAGSYGHGKTLDKKKSILHPDLKTIPHQPQVQVDSVRLLYSTPSLTIIFRSLVMVQWQSSKASRTSP